MLWVYWQDEAGGSAAEGKIKWRERFVWFPKHSYLSKKRIWLCRAWCGTTVDRAAQWLTDDEYTWYRLTDYN